jgi:hypothetical protein
LRLRFDRILDCGIVAGVGGAVTGQKEEGNRVRIAEFGLRNNNQCKKAWHIMNQMNATDLAGLALASRTASYRLVPPGTAWYRIKFFAGAACTHYWIAEHDPYLSAVICMEPGYFTISRQGIVGF